MSLVSENNFWRIRKHIITDKMSVSTIVRPFIDRKDCERFIKIEEERLKDHKGSTIVFEILEPGKESALRYTNKPVLKGIVYNVNDMKKEGTYVQVTREKHLGLTMYMDVEKNENGSFDTYMLFNVHIIKEDE